MNKADFYYIQNLNKILKEGYKDESPRPKYKDGTPAHSIYITQVFEEYDLTKNEFPIPTLRNTAIKTGIKEILWIYQDQTSSLDVAHKKGINWWDEWNIGDGTIGQRYGSTIKKWDIMNKLLKNLKEDPFSRRHIMNMWQEQDLAETKGLFPCAYETIWSVRKIEGEFFLDMTLMQRSHDYLMCVGINKIQYVALQMMVANHLGYKIGKFCHFVQNLHIYDRHMEAANEILSREPLTEYPGISLVNKPFYDVEIGDFGVYGTDNIKKIESPLELAI